MRANNRRKALKSLRRTRKSLEEVLQIVRLVLKIMWVSYLIISAGTLIIRSLMNL